jgi:hypothetical protein
VFNDPDDVFQLLTAVGSLAAAATALLAAAVGPFVAARLSDRQARRETVAAYRRDWIELLRTRIAELTASAESAAFGLKHYPADDPDGWRVFADAVRTVRRLSGEVALMLNPADPGHAEMEALVDGYVETLRKTWSDFDGNISELVKTGAAVRDLTRRISKPEWERIRVGC